MFSTQWAVQVVSKKPNLSIYYIQFITIFTRNVHSIFLKAATLSTYIIYESLLKLCAPICFQSQRSLEQNPMFRGSTNNLLGLASLCQAIWPGPKMGDFKVLWLIVSNSSQTGITIAIKTVTNK